VKNGGCVLQLTALTDDGCFAIALRLFGGNAQGLHATLAQHCAEFFANVNQFIQCLAETSCIGIGDDRHGQGAACRRVHCFATVKMNFIDLHNDFSDACFHGVSCAFSATRSID